MTSRLAARHICVLLGLVAHGSNHVGVCWACCPTGRKMSVLLGLLPHGFPLSSFVSCSFLVPILYPAAGLCHSKLLWLLMVRGSRQISPAKAARPHLGRRSVPARHFWSGPDDTQNLTESGQTTSGQQKRKKKAKKRLPMLRLAGQLPASKTKRTKKARLCLPHP